MSSVLISFPYLSRNIKLRWYKLMFIFFLFRQFYTFRSWTPLSNFRLRGWSCGGVRNRGKGRLVVDITPMKPILKKLWIPLYCFLLQKLSTTRMWLKKRTRSYGSRCIAGSARPTSFPWCFCPVDTCARARTVVPPSSTAWFVTSSSREPSAPS